MVFSLPLITVFRAGAFTAENVASIASYMSVLAFALPVYGVNTYLQKIFSSLRKMGVFAAFNFVAGAAQVALPMFGASHAESFPIEIIAVGEVLFYVVADVCLFAYLRRRLGPFGLRSTAKAFLVEMCIRDRGLHTVIGEGAAPDELGAHVAGGEDDGAVERHFQAEGREAGVLHERRGACLLYTSLSSLRHYLESVDGS